MTTVVEIATEYIRAHVTSADDEDHFISVGIPITKGSWKGWNRLIDSIQPVRDDRILEVADKIAQLIEEDQQS